MIITSNNMILMDLKGKEFNEGTQEINQMPLVYCHSQHQKRKQKLVAYQWIR